MKTMVIVALIVLSAAASVRGEPAQTAAPNPNQQGMPPRPRKCHAVLYPVQFWGTDGSGRTVTWVAYTPYYVCY